MHGEMENEGKLVKSDPPLVKMGKQKNAMVQNLGFCAFLTIAYLTAPLIGKDDFETGWYLVLMAAAIGLINLPKTIGKSAGSIGPLTVLGMAPKLLVGYLTTKINGH